ncbi:MAG: tetratricopeptide repeat protein [Desulfarculaceae bacterium]|nr:tetratricopeptide repeat protein [Desulfarculaceae bacterium]MCF8122188.1 tetratricopeptide repeat protein [Desulfarculaceae bacterium]
MIRRILISALALLLLAAAPALAAPAQDCPEEPRLTHSVHRVLFEAQQLMEKKKDAQAAQKLAQYAKGHDQAHPRFWFLRGVLAYQAKQRDEAGVYFAKAMEGWPCFQAAVRNLAVVRYEQGKPAEAARLAYRAFLLSKPPDYNLLYEASVFVLGAGQAAKALPWLDELCARPQPKKAWLTALLRAYLDLKRNKQAAKVLKRLLARWPEDASLWRLGASLATMDKDYAEAAAALAVAYRLQPPKEAGWRQLADLYRAAGSPLAAIPFYLKAWGGEPKGIKQLDRLADLYLQGHDLARATVWSQKAATAQPTARRWARAGRIYLEQKAYPAAHAAFSNAAKLEDKHHGKKNKGGRYWLLAGYAAWQNEQLPLAEAAFSNALHSAVKNSNTAKEAVRGLKAVREQRRQQAEG